MDILKPKAVIGTNAWGNSAYEKLIRGNSVDNETLIASMNTVKEKDLLIFDLAQDYGFGKAQKMIGEFGTQDIYISSNFILGMGCTRRGNKELFPSADAGSPIR